MKTTKTLKTLLFSLCVTFALILSGCTDDREYNPVEDDYSTFDSGFLTDPDFDFTSELSETETYEFLTHTIYAEPIGLQGFEGEFALDYEENPMITVENEIEFVEIIVQFHTPSQIALELADDIRQGRGVGNHNARYTHARRERRARMRGGDPFEQEALVAHENFEEQISGEFAEGEGIDIRLLDDVEVIHEHHLLFNGLHLRVPVQLVEFIAGLPEVYAIFPHVPLEVPDIDFDDILPEFEVSSQEQSEQSDVLANELQGEDENLQPEMAFDASRFTTISANFMSFTREYLGIDTLNNLNGTGTITGAGVRVGVIDSGIDHNHPRFAPFRDNTGQIRGHNSHENGFGGCTHGTRVSGAVIGIAPGVELWHYRINMSSNTGGMTTTAALEQAVRDGMDVVNMSFGAAINHPFEMFSAQINTAVLNGLVVVASAGNSGVGPYIMTRPSVEALSIGVAAAQRGGDRHNLGDVLRSYSSRGPIGVTHHIGPDIAAPSGVVTTDVGGGYAIGTGTSHAAPVISGIAALVLQSHPTATPLEVKARMTTTARAMGTNTNGGISVTQHGAGMVQPVAAVSPPIVITTQHAVPLTANQNTVWSTQTMPSFSFGELRSGTLATNLNTIPASIRNTSNTTRTVRLEIDGPNIGRATDLVQATLSRQTMTLTPGQTGDFSLTVSARGSVPNDFYGGHVVVRDDETNTVLGRSPFLLVNQTGTANVNASQLSFNMGGADVTPSGINWINVNHGTALQNYINNLPAFTRHYGGITDGAPTRPGYSYNGWSLNNDCTQMIDETSTMPTANTTLFACWEEIHIPTAPRPRPLF